MVLSTTIMSRLATRMSTVLLPISRSPGLTNWEARGRQERTNSAVRDSSHARSASALLLLVLCALAVAALLRWAQ